MHINASHTLRSTVFRTILLRTVESNRGSEIELASTEVTLFSTPFGTAQPLPSVHPFSIPLPNDTPQCIHTPYSSILHTLTATLHPIDSSQANISHSVIVHTRRYTSHPYPTSITPETKGITEPTKVEVQVPRTTFRTGEPIPLYLTVPPPRRELILDEGIRLRNVRAELLRVVSLNDAAPPQPPTDKANVPEASSSATAQKSIDESTTESLDLRFMVGSPGGVEVVAMSGASCRLHPTKAVQIRLVLHPRHECAPTESVSSDITSISPELANEAGARCASISQTTLLHDVTFMICVHVTFMHMSSHTERICTMTIPVMIIPPAAPLPEIEESMDMAYHKKHDRPPTRTVRQDEADVPRYSAGEAGPSFANAPPPFEEREAPPPFFPPEPEASSSRPPTFLESEAEIYVPAAEDLPVEPPLPPSELVFDGEGTLFGFPSSAQFDGYHEQDRPVTPPPSMEMATLDPDVTSLATLDQSAALNALELALEQHQDASNSVPPPPPPPPMDDPSDPPPSIDSDFRSPGSQHIPSSPSPHVAPAFAQQDGGAAAAVGAPPAVSHGHAPPPYQVPGDHHTEDDDHVTNPPPYVDLVPANIQAQGSAQGSNP